MAGKDSNTNLTEPMFADSERGIVALKATWEIEALSKFVAEKLWERMENKYLDDDLLVLKGIVMRIKTLNSVIMSAVGDDLAVHSTLKSELG